MSTLAAVLTASGGALQLVGLGLVVREILDDRARARSVFSAKSPSARPARRYPGKALPRSGAASPFEAMRSAAQQQQVLRAAISKIEAAVYNALIDMRKSLDEQHDTAVEGIRDEVAAADNELRGHLRYVLAGSIRKRAIGAALLGAGIVLQIAGAIVGTGSH